MIKEVMVVCIGWICDINLFGVGKVFVGCISFVIIIVGIGLCCVWVRWIGECVLRYGYCIKVVLVYIVFVVIVCIRRFR